MKRCLLICSLLFLISSVVPIYAYGGTVVFGEIADNYVGPNITPITIEGAGQIIFYKSSPIGNIFGDNAGFIQTNAPNISFYESPPMYNKFGSGASFIKPPNEEKKPNASVEPTNKPNSSEYQTNMWDYRNLFSASWWPSNIVTILAIPFLIYISAIIAAWWVERRDRIWNLMGQNASMLFKSGLSLFVLVFLPSYFIVLNGSITLPSVLYASICFIIIWGNEIKKSMNLDLKKLVSEKCCQYKNKN